MPKFSYKVIEQTGETNEGVIEGADKYSIAAQFRSEGKTVVYVESEEKRSIFRTEKLILFFSRVTLQERIALARNMGAMIGAGLSVSRALSVLEGQTINPKLKKVLKDLSEEVRKGSPLSEAMSKEPNVFSLLFVSMVRAGEESGNLGQSLGIVADQLEKTYVLRKKIRGAMIYPAVVISAMVIIGILMFIFVIPTLLATFQELNVELPVTTRAIIAISNFLSTHYLLVLLFFLLAVAGFIYGLRTKRGKRAAHYMVLHIPVISKIAKEANAARTARTLASLLAAGVDIIEAISITRDVLQNSYFKDVLSDAEGRVQKGIPLSAIFLDYGQLYPILLGEMVAVGEETGKLSDMLIRVGMFYEGEVDTATKNLSTIIEPVLMIIIGFAVGIFAVSMITPMYSIVDTI